MSVFAHVAGLPLEEVVPAAAVTVGGGLVVTRAWLIAHLRRGRNPGK